MLVPRSSGVLLHPTSLPGRYGIGDLGEWAYNFVDWLESAYQTLWQILPLGPTSYGDSPYQTLSAFAGNAYLVSLDKVAREGWLTQADLADVPNFPADHVDYGWIIPYHTEILTRAFQNFSANASAREKQQFAEWCAENGDWLDDYALFMALKDEHGGRPWVEWERGVALRDPQALIDAQARHTEAIQDYKFRQWLFFRQWLEVKTYANGKGIKLIGDVPIFVAHDSADVWANRSLFYLDDVGNPTVVAGVPPDYFSQTGQYWGNPLYRWDEMSKDGYSWWIRRFKAVQQQVDLIRIDHFRGFEAYWEIPTNEARTAVNGQWVEGPGIPFFRVIEAALGDLPIIAEDLGVITPGVEAMRDGLGLPGMKVLQFAWGNLPEANLFLPHHHIANSVVYSGTHDNNTTIGWWESETDEHIRRHLALYTNGEITEPNWALIRIAQASVSHMAVVPMQDVLSLGKEARMNTPNVPAGNWSWRMAEENFADAAARDRLRDLTLLYGRAHGKRAIEYLQAHPMI
jgi:4-alpha-glucanotransferase